MGDTGVRSAGYLVGSQVVASGCMFALSVVTARALGPAGKGFYDIALNSATLLTTFTGLSLASGVLYHASRGELDLRRSVALALAFSAAQAVVVAAVLAWLGGHPFLAWLMPGGSRVAAALMLGCVLLMLQSQQLLRALATGRGLFRDYAVSEVLARTGALGAALALALAGVTGAVPYVAAFGGTLLLAVAWLAAALLRLPSAGGALPLAAMVGYSLPLYLGNVVQFLNYRLDVFFVKGYAGLAAVGTYTVAVGLAQILWLVPNALAPLVMRAVASAGGNSDVAARVAEVNRFCMYLSALGAATVAVAARFMLGPVFGRDFVASLAPLLVLLPGVVVFSTTIVLSAFLNGMRRQAWTTYVACGSLVVTLGLDLALIPSMGTVGAAIASSASYTLSTLVTLYLARRLNDGLRPGLLLVPKAQDVARARAAWDETMGRLRRRPIAAAPVPRAVRRSLT